MLKMSRNIWNDTGRSIGGYLVNPIIYFGSYLISFPSIVANDIFVLVNAVQTLYNKTLSSPILTSPSISGTVDIEGTVTINTNGSGRSFILGNSSNTSTLNNVSVDTLFSVGTSLKRNGHTVNIPDPGVSGDTLSYLALAETLLNKTLDSTTVFPSSISTTTLTATTLQKLSGVGSLIISSNGGVDLQPTTNVFANGGTGTFVASLFTAISTAVTISSANTFNVILDPGTGGKVLTTKDLSVGNGTGAITAQSLSTSSGELGLTGTTNISLTATNSVKAVHGTGASLLVNGGLGTVSAALLATTGHLTLSGGASGNVILDPGLKVITNKDLQVGASGTNAITAQSLTASSGALTLQAGSNSNVELVPQGAGFVNVALGMKFPTSGGTAGLLNYFEDKTTVSGTFSGPFTANQTFSFNFGRLGPFVFIWWSVQNFAANNTAAIIQSTSASFVPTRFCPAADTDEIVVVVSSSNAGFGRITVGSNTGSGGYIKMYSGASTANTFAATGSAGLLTRGGFWYCTT